MESYLYVWKRLQPHYHAIIYSASVIKEYYSFYSGPKVILSVIGNYIGDESPDKRRKALLQFILHIVHALLYLKIRYPAFRLCPLFSTVQSGSYAWPHFMFEVIKHLVARK